RLLPRGHRPVPLGLEARLAGGPGALRGRLSCALRDGRIGLGVSPAAPVAKQAASRRDPLAGGPSPAPSAALPRLGDQGFRAKGPQAPAVAGLEGGARGAAGGRPATAPPEGRGLLGRDAPPGALGAGDPPAGGDARRHGRGPVSRILLYGLCPLPFENTGRNYGPGIRTWQFAVGLAGAGHAVRLVAWRIPGAYEGSPEPLASESREGIGIERVLEVEFHDPRTFARHLAEHRPDGLVGATVYGSHALAAHAPALPFFADEFGSFMAEAQARAARDGSNWPVAHFWKLQREVLRRAD